MKWRSGFDGSDHGTTRTASSAEHSTDHSESIYQSYLLRALVSAASAESGVGEEETQQSMLRPVTVVAAGGIGWGEEGAVPAVEGFDVGDVGVREDGGAALGEEAQEGVVRRVEDERGDSDAIENAGSGGVVVVVVSAGEAGVQRGDAIVELAKGADAGGTAGVVGPGEERCLALEAAEQGAQELDLVEAVHRLMKRIRRWSKIDGGRDADDGTELWRCRVAKFAGELECEIAAHGVADERDGLEPVRLCEEAHHGEHVA